MGTLGRVQVGEIISQGFKDPSDAQDIKQHPWFKGIKWELLSVSPAPWIPDVSQAQHVDEAEINSRMMEQKAKDNAEMNLRKRLAFVGFTHRSPAAPP